MSRNTRYNSKSMDAVGDPWDCKLCNKIFAESDAKLLECQHCKEHFCIKCLTKSNTEYDILSKSETMWFCVKCRKIVEEHIVIDLKIEERCKKIMDNYEQRINDIEIEMVKKCDEPRAREIVKEELELNSCNEPMVKRLWRK